MNKESKNFVENLLWDILNIPYYTGNELNIARYFKNMFKQNKFKTKTLQKKVLKKMKILL